VAVVAPLCEALSEAALMSDWIKAGDLSVGRGTRTGGECWDEGDPCGL
jgi:hypothetical protein